ncbi:MAG: saccharopine dehydrogenase NADP-binding domain-containing protein [archaeon GB-1867-035]|nr:saccharopine dehydrogenase NADP-binding domain-containing protein [Candidatus Culexmicrobium profundum]
MSEAVLIGFGRIGVAVALDFYRSISTLTVADFDDKRLMFAYNVLGFNVLRLNATKLSELDKLKNFNLAITALPGSIAFPVVKRLVELGLNVVDVSYFPEDPWSLHELAVNNEVKLIVDAGLAPGLSNIILGYFHSKYGGLKSGKIYVGGLSQDPSLPLGIVASWSMEDLVDEYIRPARIIRDGKIVEVNPLDYTGCVEIPSLGSFECFVSDGVRTMLKTFGDADELIEYTLRYEGHLELMKFLRFLGFLSNKELVVDGCKIKLSSLLAKLFEERLVRDAPDRVVMYIEALSRSDVSKHFVMDVGYDDKLKLSAMSKVTGFTQSIIAKMVLDGLIEQHGLIPPENIGMDLKLYDHLISELRGRGIIVSETS